MRLWRGEEPEFDARSEELIDESFPEGTYTDVAGLCAVATIEQIEGQDWSLNPGRYVSGQDFTTEEINFASELETCMSDLQQLNGEAQSLTDLISGTASQILKGNH